MSRRGNCDARHQDACELPFPLDCTSIAAIGDDRLTSFETSLKRLKCARKRTEPERDGCANCAHSHRSIIVVLTTAMSVTAKYFVMYICVANPLDSA